MLLVLLQAFDPVYRITRIPVSATAPQWDHAEQETRLSEWRCNLEPAGSAPRSARMTDPARPARDCEWTAPEGAWIFHERAGWYQGPYRYGLAVQTEDGGGFSQTVDRETWIEAPRNVRVTPGH